MPGSHLSGLEKSLAARWAAPHNDPYPKLKRISVSGNPGLRGIRDLVVEFAFPVTAICGKNGSGKTTLLALAALAFHGVKGKKAPKRLSPRATLYPPYYTFGDFFFKGPSDSDVTGVTVEWEYLGADTLDDRLSITKGSKKWMHYERRPTRPVFYVGERRIIPAIEHSALRHHFGPEPRAIGRPLDPVYCERLAAVMGRPYERAGSLHSGSHAVRVCKSGAPYSSFNMGAGEDVLIELYATLQDCPPGSLVVVEEIELGLHPAAVRMLSQQLLQLARDKRLQIIVSTHSPEFIDSLPAAGRVLIRAANGHHDVIASPTTRLAMGDLTGQANAEMFVYCEDEAARAIIEESLRGDIRGRVSVIPIGSKSELLTQARSHIRTGLGHPILVFWDGDVREAEHARTLEEIKELASQSMIRFSSAYLPGAAPPEEWLVDTIDSSDGVLALSSELRIDDATTCPHLIANLQCCDAHDVAYRLSQLSGRNPDEALRILARAAARMTSDPLGPVADAVCRALTGEELDQARTGPV